MLPKEVKPPEYDSLTLFGPDIRLPIVRNSLIPAGKAAQRFLHLDRDKDGWSLVASRDLIPRDGIFTMLRSMDRRFLATSDGKNLEIASFAVLHLKKGMFYIDENKHGLLLLAVTDDIVQDFKKVIRIELRKAAV